MLHRLVSFAALVAGFGGRQAVAKTYRLTSSALQTSTSVGTFPVLPPVLVQGETLSSLVVSLPTSATISVVANVDANHWFMFSPSTLVGGAQTLSLAIQGGGTATGEYTIQYVSTSTNETLYASQITVVPPPVAYAVHEPAWTGTTLASDTFDTLPFGAIPNATTSFWQQVDHGFASDACGKSGTIGNALYFTHLGKRAAATTPFDLKGIDAQLSFAYIYGHRANPTYDAWGNNTLSCELVQAGAEVAVEMSIDNATTWQPLVVLALPPTPTSTMQTTSLPLTSPSSVSMSGATAAGSVTSSFRWIQHTHTSTRVGSIQGTRYQWQYRNLFDQWAIDNVLLTARIQQPKLAAASPTFGRDSLTVQVVTTATRGIVLAFVGDGTHPFPVCNDTAFAAGPSNATVSLRTTGFIHAVACWRGGQSYGYRSPRLSIQSLPPTFQVHSSGSQSYVVTVTMPRANMQLWFTFGTGDEAPSCTFGSFLNVAGSTATMTIGSNGVLRALACGPGVVGSEIVMLPPFVVQPKAPTIALVDAVPITTTAQFNVSITADDAADSTVLARLLLPTDTDTTPPSCRDAAPASVGTAFVTLRPHERVVGVACCGSTYCNDSAPVVYGPVDASCARPTLATRCSTTAMRTIVATLTPGTSGGIVKYATSASDALTCSDAWPTYTAPLELSPATMAATTVVVKALTCVDGLKASDSLVTTVAVDMCCAGALTFPSSLPDQPCSHVLLFRDDFAACNITKWTKHTTQYGGDNINGGVHSDNVQCLANSADFSGASTLALIVNGDRYPGTAPVGVRVQSDGSVTARLPTTPLNGWALPGVRSFPCPIGTVTCAARRVGAAISTVDAWNAGVATFQLKSCSAFGVATEVWALDILGIQSAVAAPSTLPFADLWRAALEQARTSPILHFSHGSAITDNRVHTFVLQWNRIEGRANVYRDGQLIRKLRSLPSSPDATPLTFHAYVPNAWAGEPRFTSCSTQIANVQVVNVETAANRWCDWENEAPVSCTSDAACTQWMAGACLMPVASAVCVNKACAFALHPQFASPAVQAATAYRST
ncbi:hypothetical protein H310_06979 [Aphanomyces invadans]|uniref:GH16 domain-containing protein n=1 Tax=Aphanomyces invadans TaxID=157072 RepID=A0A024U4Z8_9STRA|nr:hypothetical protein H310_06979 [Aphanomyces invadans]ETW01466.1 hypothetical protein H310_06979 [Aphanomyces invadans]|eukprot:XP_008870464.1 hypothetical protein H310_06979 [Aphanomyces invadans]